MLLIPNFIWYIVTSLYLACKAQNKDYNWKTILFLVTCASTQSYPVVCACGSLLRVHRAFFKIILGYVVLEMKKVSLLQGR